MRVGEWLWCPRFQNRDSTIAAHLPSLLLPPTQLAATVVGWLRALGFLLLTSLVD